MKYIKVLFILVLLGLCLGVVSVLGMYFYLKDDLPSVEVLKDVELQTPMRIFTQDGKLISQYGVKRRIPVKLEEVPEALKHAVIATEDSRFYEHMGVDPIGVMRAVVSLAVTGEKRQGASTLTMQLARGFFLNRRKEFSRKIKEVFIAYHMEQELSKDEILELYLNKIELGHRSFGFGAAAQVYYGKSLNELNLAQLATLAGLPQAPSALNPISNPVRSKERRRIVLLRMLDEGYITQAEFDEAANAPVSAKKHGAEIEVDAPYLADMVYNEMVALYGKEIAETSGFNVYATAHSDIQEAAQRAVVQNLHDYDERHGFRGPIAVLWKPLTEESLKEYGVSEPLSPEEAQQIQEQHGNFSPLTEAELINALAEFKAIGALVPAVVLNLEEQSATVLKQDGETILLDWQGLDWAREYISDSAQGNEPERAADILHEGMVVYVRKRFDDGQWQLSQMPDASGAFVALNPFDGAVEAVVGGYDFYDSQFNRATQAKRQVGSNIKPFIYSAALDNGYTLASIINDAPINQWDASSGVAWRPQNSPAVYDGPIRMRKALGKSKNVVSVRLLRGVGLDKTRDYITRFGFLREEVPRDETMSLGSGSHTPLEVASAMAIFANGGFAVRPYFIQRIENGSGDLVWEAEPLLACDPCDHLNVDDTRTAQASLDSSMAENNTHNSEPLSLAELEAQLAEEFSAQGAGNALGAAKSDLKSDENNKTKISKSRSAPRVLSEQTAFLVREMLSTAVRANGSWNTKTFWVGTGWRARNLLDQRSDIGGKTGTTNDARDTWFTGFAPGLVASAWVGFDDPARELGRATRNQNLINRNPERFNWIGNALIGAEDGAKAAQPAWIRFMQSVLEDVPEETKMIPEGIVRVRIDRETGKLTTRTDSSSMFEYFVQGTEPNTFVQDSDLSLPVEEERETEEDPLFDDIF
uniref:penicillin-binding protein 1A n=1 Tax=Ningiella ruwaisensis TaxID=2364274 RepID=UPI0010A07B44|nr:PBP1A family penicillin-binding protein [Ningiella ruwaisensis]